MQVKYTVTLGYNEVVGATNSLCYIHITVFLKISAGDSNKNLVILYSIIFFPFY